MNALNFVDSLLLLQSTGLLWHEISWNYPSWTVSTELFAAAIVYALAHTLWTARASADLRRHRRRLGRLHVRVYRGAARLRPRRPIRTLYGLALGYLLYRLHTRFEIIRGPVWGTIAEVLAIAFVLLLVRSPATRPYWYLVTLGLAVVIYVFASEQGLISSAFRKLQLHHLGTASYSIYLNHALIGIIFSKLYLTVAAKLGIVGAVSVAVYVPTFVLLLIVYSGFTLRYIESTRPCAHDARAVSRVGPDPPAAAESGLPRPLGARARAGGLSPLEQPAGRLVGRQGARKHGIRQLIEVASAAFLDAPGDALGGGPRDQVAGAAAAACLRALGQAARADVGDGLRQGLDAVARGRRGLEHRHLARDRARAATARPCSCCSGAVGALAVGLVDDHDVGDLDQPRLHGLDVVAEARAR